MYEVSKNTGSKTTSAKVTKPAPTSIRSIDGQEELIMMNSSQNRNKDDDEGFQTVVNKKKKRRLKNNQKTVIDYVGKDKKINEVNTSQAGWEKLVLKIDSGAVDTVIPKSICKAFPVRPTEMSRAGEGYRAANGSPIPAYGEKQLSGVTDEWLPFNIKAQVAGVKSPLGSVMHMIKSGNTLVFDSQGSYMRNKASGRVMPIHEREGSFEMDLWVKGSPATINESSREESVKKSKQRYSELADDDDEDDDAEGTDMDFVRQACP